MTGGTWMEERRAAGAAAWDARCRGEREAEPIRAAMGYIEGHYMEPVTLERVAAVVGFNPTYFSTVFKKRCGQGFVDYLTGVRIARAQELLRGTDAPMTEICFRIGYKDLKHFNRTFKRRTALTPREYRRLHRARCAQASLAAGAEG